MTCPVLVGRIQEIAALDALLDSGRTGQGSVVLISGDAGIGKSRLVAYARNSALARGFGFLQGNCYEADISYPYAPLLALWRASFTNRHRTPIPTAPPRPISVPGPSSAPGPSPVAPGAPEAVDKDPLVPELLQLLPDLALLFPDLVPSSRRPPQPLPRSLAPGEDSERHKRRLFALLTHFLTGHASPPTASQGSSQPVLLVIEDLHWCDESSLDFLLHLVRHCQLPPLADASRLFLLFTYRSDEASQALNRWLAQLDRERLAIELPLAPLSYEEVDAMLRAMLMLTPPDHLDTELVAAIHTLTEGNPFFVEEVLKSLIAAGEFQRVEGRWGTPGTSKRRSDKAYLGTVTSVPRSVQDSVQQRSKRLSAEARQALNLAAVAGRRFAFSLLRQVLHDDEDRLLTLMKELIAAQLLVEEEADQFAFRHALIREAIYSRLLARERRALHRTIAEALESLYASQSVRAAHLPELAYHFCAAGAQGNWAKALEYAQRAGDRALALYAPGVAIEHFSDALEAADQGHVTPPGGVYLARGRAYEMRGEFDRALSDFERALELARRAADTAADGTSDGGADEESGNARELEWQSMMAIGFLWAARDYAQAGEWFRRASERAARMADPGLRAHSLNRLGNWLTNTGRIKEGLQAHQEALRIFEAQQHTRGIAETLDLLGPAQGMFGDRVGAVAQLGRAIDLFRGLGDKQSLMSSLAMRAVQSMPGSSETTFSPLRTRDECVQDATEALHLAGEIGSLAAQAFAENALAHTLLSFGEFGAALVHAQYARRIADEIGHQQWKIATSYALGRIYLLLLSPAPAMDTLQAGLALAQELGSQFWVTTLAANLARAYILSDDLAGARATLQAALPAMSGLGEHDAANEAHEPNEGHAWNVAERDVVLAWGELALAQGQPERALRIAEQLLASVPEAPAAPGEKHSQPDTSVGTDQTAQAAQPIPSLLRLEGEALMALSELDSAIEPLEAAKQGAQERNTRPVLWTVQRALGQAYQLLQRGDQAWRAFAAGRALVQDLASTLDGSLDDQAELRDRFERAALDSLPGAGNEPLRPRKGVKAEKARKAREAREAKQASGGLTAREREVAVLIAQGKTSREIASLLVIQERTTEVHVSNILGKLGFTSRAQIAAWAVQKGLVQR